MATPNLSAGAWAVLEQLASGPVWDGDLVDKEGRSVLVSLGYARRARQGNDSRRLAINMLTKDGKELAARYRPIKSQRNN